MPVISPLKILGKPVSKMALRWQGICSALAALIVGCTQQNSLLAAGLVGGVTSLTFVFARPVETKSACGSGQNQVLLRQRKRLEDGVGSTAVWRELNPVYASANCILCRPGDKRRKFIPRMLVPVWRDQLVEADWKSLRRRLN